MMHHARHHATQKAKTKIAPPIVKQPINDQIKKCLAALDALNREGNQFVNIKKSEEEKTPKTNASPKPKF